MGLLSHFNSSTVTVRRASRRGCDLDRVLDCCEADLSPWSEDAWSCIFRDSWIRCLVAESAGEVVGVAVYRFRLWGRSIACVKVFVRADWRRRGVGRLLLEAMKSAMRRHDCRKLVMSVPPENLGAQLWLRACGVRCVGENRFLNFEYRR